MGLLDQAIRQHLELKRKHGAGDRELEIEAEEALGPVRSERVEPAPPAPGGWERTYDPRLGEGPGEAPAATEDQDRLQQDPLEPPGEPAAEVSLGPPPEAFHEPVDPFVRPTRRRERGQGRPQA